MTQNIVQDMPNPKHKVQRLEFIDGLRGVAILLVLLTHAWSLTGAPALSVRLGGIVIVLGAIPAIGYVGVNLFLVLSGFCLAWPFLSVSSYQEKMNLARFWMRRIRRIIPAYYLSIIVVFGIYLLFGKFLQFLPAEKLAEHPTALATIPNLGEIWTHLLLIHNLFPRHVSTINGSYWSLALEFQLYLFFPLFMTLFLRGYAWTTLFMVLCLQLAYGTWLYYHVDARILTALEFVVPKSVFGRMFDFVAGIMAANFLSKEVLQKRQTSKLRTYLCVGFLFGAFLLTYLRFSFYPVIDILWASGFAFLIIQCGGGQISWQRLMTWKPLVSLGTISYSVYLLHQPLLERVAYIIKIYYRPGTAFFLGLASIPFIILLSAAFYSVAEKPFLSRSVVKAQHTSPIPIGS